MNIDLRTSGDYLRELTIEDGGTTIEVDVGCYNREDESHSMDLDVANNLINVGFEMYQTENKDDCLVSLLEENHEDIIDGVISKKIYSLEDKFTESEFEKVCHLLGI